MYVDNTCSILAFFGRKNATLSEICRVAFQMSILHTMNKAIFTILHKNHFCYYCILSN